MASGVATARTMGNRFSRLSIRRESQAYALLFLVPTALLFVGLVGYPVLYSLLLTVSGRGAAPGQLGAFVGLANWARIASDPIFSQAVVQTLMYVIPAAVLGVLVGLGVALVLNERFPGRRIVR
ncbi:MAG TPA: hypothetical protein VE817_00545, partial [Candidatus Acidoferrum sp.]|nr:hypothetical protein [Candidatus Acidoferrum sp.]